ncbi:hypothetical protein [Novosphingobium pokkalii]|uniref:Uncharacterized protein n=2 Tax=Novosphingobium pokkalii TaxID=1770194 RepID=A0ABV7V904_9SPHN|nr:hypothetical protein [Novosphingobium pokkalii]
MIEVPLGRFDIYALALPRGHGFGDQIPHEAWETGDGKALAIITRHADHGDLGLVVMRRRTDGVWATTCDLLGLEHLDAVRDRARIELREGEPPQQVPPGIQRRTALYDVEGREPSEIFRMLTAKSHRNVAWLLNQLYLSLPRPDRNWAADCQTGNFHTRLWEAQLLASFREQGLLLTQPMESPDFRIENRKGGTAWVEAVTANPQERFEPVGAMPSIQPEENEELFSGTAALRFAKTIGSKLQRRYAEMDHVAGHPFAIAMADFHAPGSMVWSREALLGYLYGFGAEPIEINGKRVAAGYEVKRLLGPSKFPAGLFRNDAHAELSAVIFTNACALSKFNRVALTRGMQSHVGRYVRYGRFYDRKPGALEGIPFCFDVLSDDYRALWPQGWEPWCAELEVFHNPFARHPLPTELLPEASHWLEVDGAMDCRHYYDTGILWSRSLIIAADDPMPTYETLPAWLEDLARRRAARE